MVTARIEFSQGEIATFEFGRELTAIPQQAAFIGAGAVVVIPVSSATANSNFDGAGIAVAEPDLVAILSADYLGASSAAAVFEYTSLYVAGMSSAGSSSGTMFSGLATLSEMAATGTGLVLFHTASEPGFDISARGEVLFRSSAYATSQAASAGSAVGSFGGQSSTNAVAVSAGVAAVAAWAGSIANASAASDGRADGAFSGYRLWIASMQSTGVASVAGAGQTVSNVRAQAAGVAATDFLTRYLLRQYAVAAATGSSAVAAQSNSRVYQLFTFNGAAGATGQFVGQVLSQAPFFVYAPSSASWIQGSQVLGSMVFAYDIIERPEEDRGVERPEEQRTAEWV